MLNNAQKRSLSITLRIIEQSLDEIAVLAGGEGTHGGTLYRVENDLSAASRNEIQTQAQLIRERIAFLARQFDLDPDEHTVSSITEAKLNYCWEILQKEDSKGLWAFGPVAEGLDKALDPHIAALLELILRLLHDLEKHSLK